MTSTPPPSVHPLVNATCTCGVGFAGGGRWTDGGAAAGNFPACIEVLCPGGIVSSGRTVCACRAGYVGGGNWSIVDEAFPQCVACEPGSFRTAAMPGHGNASCTPWSSSTKAACAAGKQLRDDGTPVSDRTCGPCGYGTYRSKNMSTCAPWSSNNSLCDVGHELDYAGNATHDRPCV